MLELENIIGLEIHVQLKTKRKMFCFCENNTDAEVNTNICPICLGHPGTLPILNKEAINLAIKLALALNANINQISQFARKNYFYPDLPKAYQISQDDKPIATDAYLSIFYNNEWKKCEIERLHLEEDSAKNLHSKNADTTWIDYNRAGIPLIEIVTKPIFHYPEEAKLFLQELRLLLRTLNISDANMEKAELRCDANISLKPKNEDKFYPKTEIKNLNSFKAVEKALSYEIIRQRKLWEEGKIPEKSETRGWDEKNNQTIIQRSKESLNDYRYFPEPDIPLLKIENEEIQKAEEELKNIILPWQRRKILMNEYYLNNEQINYLLENKYILEYFENTVSELEEWLRSSQVEYNKKEISQLAINYILNKIPGYLKKKNIEWKELKLSAENLAELLTLLYKKEIKNNLALQLLEKMVSKEKNIDPSHLLDELKLDDNNLNLEELIQNIINNFPEEKEKYQNGKKELLRFFIGQVMKASKGQADPQESENLLKKYLEK